MPTGLTQKTYGGGKKKKIGLGEDSLRQGKWHCILGWWFLLFCSFGILPGEEVIDFLQSESRAKATSTKRLWWYRLRGSPVMRLDIRSNGTWCWRWILHNIPARIIYISLSLYTYIHTHIYIHIQHAIFRLRFRCDSVFIDTHMTADMA